MIDKKFTDIHIHTFSINHVPSDFLPLGIGNLIESNFSFKICKLLSKIVMPSKGDVLDRYIKFAQIARHKNQEGILKHLINKYPNGKFIILAIDFEHMGLKNKPKISFIQQLEELASLKKKYGNKIVPFIHVDPRREKIFELTKTTIEDWKFAGVKIYPPMGYTINDLGERMLGYLEHNSIPITTHCSTNCPIYYKGKDIDDLILEHCYFMNDLNKNDSNRRKTDIFSNPIEYEVSLIRHPRLKLNFAHFGGWNEWNKIFHSKDSEWINTIIRLMNSYKDVYADVSSTLANENFPIILEKFIENKSPCIRNKILFGTDYYLCELEEEIFLKIIKRFDNKFFNQMQANNERFLGEK